MKFILVTVLKWHFVGHSQWWPLISGTVFAEKKRRNRVCWEEMVSNREVVLILSDINSDFLFLPGPKVINVFHITVL